MKTLFTEYFNAVVDDQWHKMSYNGNIEKEQDWNYVQQKLLPQLFDQPFEFMQFYPHQMFNIEYDPDLIKKQARNDKIEAK